MTFWKHEKCGGSVGNMGGNVVPLWRKIEVNSTNLWGEDGDFGEGKWEEERKLFYDWENKEQDVKKKITMPY